MNLQRCARAAVAVLLVLSAACSSDDGQDASTDGTSAPPTDELILGLLVPESGDLSAIVDSLAKPTRLAVDQINAAGGVNGKPVKIVQADDGSSATVATNSFDRLLNSDRVNAIVGPASSGTASGIMDKIKTRGVVACSGSTTAAELSDLDSGGFFFRTAPSDDLQGPALAEVVAGDGRTRVGILARNDTYGTGFADSVRQALEDSGATVVANVAYDPNGTNFDGDVGQVLGATPDAVVVLGFNDDGARIVSTLVARGAGPDVMPIYTADGMQSSSFAAAVDPANPARIAGIKGTAPAGAPEGVESPFQEEFPKLEVDPIFSAYYWDCTNLIALAAQKAGSTDPAAIRDAFASNLEGDTDCNDFRSCKEALERGETIHYHGASNTFDTWNQTEPGTGAYEVWQYGPDGKAATLPVPQIKI